MTKEKSCLVTTSLVGSVRWCVTAPHTVIKPEKGGDGKTTWNEKALQDLKNTLGRVKTPFPEAAQRGVNFEKAVYHMANKEKNYGTSKFIEVCNSVRGYEFFQKGGMDITIGDNKCYLYCKYDAVKKSVSKSPRGENVIHSDIKDIKTTQNYKGGKYLKTFQHKLYCYVANTSMFQYVIAEWGEYPVVKGIHYEEYVVKDFGLLEKEVLSEIEDTFETIKDLGLWDLYRTKYCLY